MFRTHRLAVCAAMALAIPGAHAVAQDVRPAASPPATVGAKTTKAAKRRKPAVAATSPTAAPSQPYQLVPTAGSALTRARQNAFDTPDAPPSSGDRGRRLGVGLGGASGMSPGMSFGF